MPLNKIKDYRFFLSVLLIITLSLTFYLTFFKRKSQNIVLITIDALRADHLSCYGYKRQTTPNIDKLAKEGVLFLQAVAPSTDTFHSMPVMMTSTYSHYYNVEQWFDALINPSAPTLAEILRDRGYRTALFSDGAPFYMIKGADRGFETYAVREAFSADKLTNNIIKWLELNKREHFFLWIHYFDPHAPYQPPKPFDTLYVGDSLTAEDKQLPIDSGNDMFTSRSLIPHIVAEGGITSVNHYIAKYDGEIRFVDEQIGLLQHKLKGMGLDKDTVMIITADHGESLGEHDIYFQHGGVPYDSLLLVPLIFKCDNLIPEGIKIGQQVSSADIFPTILDILNIKYHNDIRGESFLDLMQGKTGNHTNRAFSNSQSPIYSMRAKKWKLISLDNSREYYLFDLENDKTELNNIKDVRKEEFNIFSKELNEWIEKNKSMVYPENKSSLDKEALEKLKSLGYLQGGGEDAADKKIARPFSKLMDTYNGPTVTVSGEVIFDSYKDGAISIFARTEDRSRPPNIAILTIPKPGKYILNIPKDFGNIYIGAINTKKGLEPEPDDPRDEYVNNPIKIGSFDIDNIDIVIKNRKN